MAEEFHLQTRALGVEVVLNNSTVLKGRVFLHSVAERHGGVEKVEDVLNAPAQFFPLSVRESGERTLLINKAQVLFIKVPTEPHRVEIGERRASASAVQVSVDLVHGAPLQGVVYLAQPPGRDRTLDGLNQSDAFLCLVQDAAFLYVNLRNVVSVRERGPQFESIPPPAP
jgi:hypothetical protein